MAKKCSNPDCAAPLNCHEGKEKVEECEYWIKTEKIKPEKNKTSKKQEKGTGFPWSGEAFSIDEIPLVSVRNSSVIMGIVGKADAGKTTFLAMLYTLLLKGGKFESFTFAGSKTLKTWDKLYHDLKVQKEQVKFPDPTPAQYIRFLHLSLRNSRGRLKDILLTDASGEVFSIWSQHRENPNAENARWIYQHANAFILFIDCADLITRKNLAKTEIIDLAQMLQHDLKDRPLIAVWSKSDCKNEIHPKIKESLETELKHLFSHYTQIDISNFSSSDPDILVHKNNISVLDWLLSEIYNYPIGCLLENDEGPKGDLFLNYKGK